jgi:hypothetical protein
MGLPSYLADIEDKAADSRAVAGLFAHGTAGAAGIGSFSRARKNATATHKARKAEAEARILEERSRRYVDDVLAWRAATADVTPLQRRISHKW